MSNQCNIITFKFQSGVSVPELLGCTYWHLMTGWWLQVIATPWNRAILMSLWCFLLRENKIPTVRKTHNGPCIFFFTLNVFVAMAHRKLVEVYSRMQFQRWEKKKCLVFTVTTVPTGFKIKKYCPVWPPKENNAQHRTMCTVLVSSDSTSALWHGQWMSNQCMSDARKTGTKINSVFFWHIWWGEAAAF